MIALAADVAFATLESAPVDASLRADVALSATMEAEVGGTIALDGELATPAVLASFIDAD